MSIQQIIVCGAGTMGSGIAQVCAQAGQETYLFDQSGEALRAAEARIRAAWQRMLEKGRMNDTEVSAAIGRLHTTADLPAVTADLVIEAIVERPDAKIDLFKAFELPEAIFASNTSSLSISALQDALPNPERVAGMHFFNPAPLMKLVEIVRGAKTAASVTAAIEALVRSWGKIPVHCADAPGFIVNRVARPYYLEALHMAHTGAAGFEDVDRLAEATGFRMGPFRLMDLIGNDINLAVSRSLYEAFPRAARFRPSPIQEGMVARGELGRKSGKGYYSYTNPAHP
jgi:3-hydroxybutyryl-CoA dehydrogenase